MLEIDDESLKELESEYKKAIENKSETFIFKGKLLLVNYAKYLIQYVKSKQNDNK